MPSLKCNLLSHSIAGHVQQLYTGFKILKDNGLIELTQQISKHDIEESDAHLIVEVSDKNNQKLVLYFDNNDSKEINEEHLKICDVYFKRSFSREYILECHTKYESKIQPLGLNYLVLPNSFDILSFKRYLSLSSSLKKKLSGAVNSINPKSKMKSHACLRHLHSLPTYYLPPRVLFMVTAYDPYDKPDRPKEKIEERIYNNELRAHCVRMLRKELGPKFYGGFMHNEYTLRKHKDVLIDTPANGQRKNYLKILSEFPICIATTGLHGSIGWKFAEYIAFSRAIVAEKLHYEVPGQLRSNQNYLEFSSPEECVEQSMKLLTDHALRYELMKNNSEYYQNYIKPDRLVFNALSTAIYNNYKNTPL